MFTIDLGFVVIGGCSLVRSGKIGVGRTMLVQVKPDIAKALRKMECYTVARILSIKSGSEGAVIIIQKIARRMIARNITNAVLDDLRSWKNESASTIQRAFRLWMFRKRSEEAVDVLQDLA